MDPRASPSGSRARWLPRTRGDGPCIRSHRTGSCRASPHTRGWTAGSVTSTLMTKGFPAHAGMDPADSMFGFRRLRLPRTRGDGPGFCRPAARAKPASPHTRGWTRRALGLRQRLEGFPAHAGMDPSSCCRGRHRARLPRTRGDGPRSSPRTRTAAPASPHTRGWTRARRQPRHFPYGFPAHAGMDPARRADSRRRTGLPRTRGDGPHPGEGPRAHHPASPHTRGWTVAHPAHVGPDDGFPAHAGMDPRVCEVDRSRLRLPRTRGDGPEPEHAPPAAAGASPHTRGWTFNTCLPPLGGTGFPAHAGMDPLAMCPM